MPPGVGYNQGPDPRNSDFLKRLLSQLGNLVNSGAEAGKQPLQRSLVGDPTEGIRSVGGAVFNAGQEAVTSIDDLIRRLFRESPIGR